MTRSCLSRRDIFRTLAALGVAAAALPGPLAHGAADSGGTKLDVNDPKARARGYVENAAQVDKKKYPGFIAGSNCENCLLLQGAPGNNYRPCSLFDGQLVAVGGWCSGWAAEM
jgi:hypothetical protein